MDRIIRFALVAVFLTASLIASGAVNRASVTEAFGVQSSAPVSQAALAQPAAVPYFPAQYVLNAPPGTDEPISTF